MAESILTQRNFVFLLQAISPTSQRCILSANAALQEDIENISACCRFQFPYNTILPIAHGFLYANLLLTSCIVAAVALCMKPTLMTVY